LNPNPNYPYFYLSSYLSPPSELPTIERAIDHLIHHHGEDGSPRRSLTSTDDVEATEVPAEMGCN